MCRAVESYIGARVCPWWSHLARRSPGLLFFACGSVRRGHFGSCSCLAAAASLLSTSFPVSLAPRPRRRHSRRWPGERSSLQALSVFLLAIRCSGHLFFLFVFASCRASAGRAAAPRVCQAVCYFLGRLALHGMHAGSQSLLSLYAFSYSHSRISCALRTLVTLSSLPFVGPHAIGYLFISAVAAARTLTVSGAQRYATDRPSAPLRFSSTQAARVLCKLPVCLTCRRRRRAAPHPCPQAPQPYARRSGARFKLRAALLRAAPLSLDRGARRRASNQ